jgi:hypothetical protein
MSRKEVIWKKRNRIDRLQKIFLKETGYHPNKTVIMFPMLQLQGRGAGKIQLTYSCGSKIRQVMRLSTLEQQTNSTL